MLFVVIYKLQYDINSVGKWLYFVNGYWSEGVSKYRYNLFISLFDIINLFNDFVEQKDREVNFFEILNPNVAIWAVLFSSEVFLVAV